MKITCNNSDERSSGVNIIKVKTDIFSGEFLWNNFSLIGHEFCLCAYIEKKIRSKLVKFCRFVHEYENRIQKRQMVS